MSGAWTNADGLRVLFGTTEAVTGKAGEYMTRDRDRVAEVVIDLASLGTAAAIQDQFVTIPSGMRIARVELINEVAATSGGSATLNVGLQRLDRTTELDYDGFIAAGALATFDAAGETVTYTEGTTAHGALIGTTLSNAGYITADYDTAAFTAGRVRVRIYYYKP